MIVFIDTNIFFNNWYLENANFKYLFNYLENSNSKLYLPEIVCSEIDGKFHSEYLKLIDQFKDNLKRINSFLPQNIIINQKSFDIDYSFKNQLKKATDSIVFISYENISNEVLVNRAINRVRPFKDDDKGFRDSLIWLSFIEYLKKNNLKESVAFINNNPTDFYSNEKNALHSDLMSDLTQLNLKNEFRIYHSIKEFIDREVDKEHNTYNTQQILENFVYESEDQIQNEISSYINSQTTKAIQLIFKSSVGELNDIPYVTGLDFIINEGIDDPELLSWALTAGNDLYLELYLKLRLVEFRFSLPTIVYNERREYFDENFYDIETDQDETTLSIMKSPLLNVSFIFRVKKREVTNLVINSLETK
ncbi:PIN domain-containing protein [Leeuwenhoekiella sp. H156]|uniref:PIN domain-containing protein n=1 Tax=Leeuwenhoekiella sp. H156 TaxID=3450128 RepID=UPI003FA4ACDF